MKRLLYTLSICLGLAACNHDQDNGDTGVARAIKKTDFIEAERPQQGKWYKHFTGSICGIGAAVDLQEYNEPYLIEIEYLGPAFKGTYSDNKKRQTIRLESCGNRKDSVVLREFPQLETQDSSMNEDTKPAAIWIVLIAGNSIKGRWISLDGKTSGVVDLQEHYPDGSYPLSIIDHKDHLAVPWDDDTAHFDILTMILMPATDTDAIIKELITNRLYTYSELRRAGNANDFPVLLNGREVADYKKRVAAAMHKAEEEPSEYNHAIDMRTYCTYNAHGLLAFKFVTAGYTGGMHGYNDLSTFCMDMKRQKVLTLADIITADPKVLSGPLEGAAMLYFNVFTHKDLRKVLLKDKIPATENFLIMEQGLLFCYRPYEIAGYAMGDIELLVPYKDVQHLLTPTFKQQMGL